MTKRDDTTPDDVDWLTDGLQAGADDFWSVYERHVDEVHALMVKSLTEDSGTAQSLGSSSPKAVTAQCEMWPVALHSARRGILSPFVEWSRMQGVRCAELGLSLHAAGEVTRAFSRYLLPAMVDAFAADAGRLAPALQAMNDFSQFGVRLIDLVRGGDVSANVSMRPGDILIIPQSFF